MAEVGRVFHEPLSHENERAAFGMLSATEKEERARPNVSRVSLLSARSRLAVSMAGCKERATISSEETRCAYTQLAAQHGAACRAKVKRSDRKQSKDGFLFSFADLSLSLLLSLPLFLFLYPSIPPPRHYHFSLGISWPTAAAFLAWWIFARLMSFRHDSAVTVSE